MLPVLLVTVGWAQQWVFPVPGSRGITGTFGEMRFAHFHPGLDIGTYTVTGQRVVAAREGYVSRIRVSGYGYGRCLFVTHPDGYVSLYGHMERFLPQIEARLRKAQQQSRRFDQDIFLTKTEITVEAGEELGISGNTGDSGGPHLHFEIRDPNNRVLNPLLYLDTAIADQLPPVLELVALQPMDVHSRVNGEWTKWQRTPTGSENLYYAHDTLVLAGRIGLEYSAYDKLNGTPNVNGHYRTRLYLDEHPVYTSELSQITFADMLLVHLHNDFDHKMETGQWLQRCYRVAGNSAPIYRGLAQEGVLYRTDSAVHTLRLYLDDYHGNTTTYIQRVRWTATTPDLAPRYHTPGPPSWRLLGNVLVINSDRIPTGENLRLRLADGTHLYLPPTYHHPNRDVWVVPLRPEQQPVEAHHSSWTQPLQLPLQACLLPGRPTTLQWQGLKAHWGSGSVTDTHLVSLEQVPVMHPAAQSAGYRITPAGIPLFRRMELSIATTAPSQQLFVAEVGGDGSLSYAGPATGGTSLTHGTFCLARDTQAPGIFPINFADGSTISTRYPCLKWQLADDLSGIAGWSVSLRVDGQWAVGEYYPYNKYLTYWVDPTLPPGEHTATVTARDNCGNAVEQSWRFVTVE